MRDDERDAQERLRRAQEDRTEAVEGLHEAQEGIRQAQESVRETRERVGDKSRQYGEAERVTGEGGREDAEAGRVTAEDERVVAFGERTEAEESRVVAEEAREMAATGARGERHLLRTEFYVIYVLLFAVMVAGAAWLTAEGHKREDQFCEATEREHMLNVDQYRDTINVLMKIKRDKPEQLTDDPITKFIVARLPATEKRARTDTAPPLCDGEHISFPFRHRSDIGLPEPDPKLPRLTAKQVQKRLAAR